MNPVITETEVLEALSSLFGSNSFIGVDTETIKRMSILAQRYVGGSNRRKTRTAVLYLFKSGIVRINFQVL